MPSILKKKKVLDGKGEVFTHLNKNHGKWFYREKIKGVKKYKTKLIPAATSLEEAVEKAADMAILLANSGPHHLTKAIDNEVRTFIQQPSSSPSVKSGNKVEMQAIGTVKKLISR